MGTIRSGARSFLNVLADACRFSHMRGFRLVLGQILGEDNATQLMLLWTPLCAFVEALIAADNYYNQIDNVAEETGDEDDNLA